MPEYIGTFVVYLNVGNMGIERCEAFISRQKEYMKEWIDICKSQNYCVIFVPRRKGATRIVKMDFTRVDS